MATLNAKARKKLKKAMFGIPSKYAFPMNDPTHQRLAISGATRAAITPATCLAIRVQADVSARNLPLRSDNRIISGLMTDIWSGATSMSEPALVR